MRVWVLLLVLVMCATVMGCESRNGANTTVKTLHVYCGAGMRKPMSEVAKMFEKKYGVKVLCDYAGSGYLVAKIEMTKSGDDFMPGDYIFIKVLKAKGAIAEYRNFTKHIPVIVVPKGNPKHIESFYDLAKPGVRLAVGDSHIAIGVALKHILKKADKIRPGTSEKIEKNVVVRCATVNQVLLYVMEKQVDAGIVWRSNAIDNRDKVDIIPINSSINDIKTIPIAVLSYSKNPTLAKEFYNFVLTQGKSVFKKYGYVVKGGA